MGAAAALSSAFSIPGQGAHAVALWPPRAHQGHGDSAFYPGEEPSLLLGTVSQSGCGKRSRDKVYKRRSKGSRAPPPARLCPGPQPSVQPQAVLAARFWTSHHQKAAAGRGLGRPRAGPRSRLALVEVLGPWPALLVKHQPATGLPGHWQGPTAFPCRAAQRRGRVTSTGVPRSWGGAEAATC